ncbi:MAG: helix-turn-helix domain-containing protein, partial [Sandaracinaceae bacterium]
LPALRERREDIPALVRHLTTLPVADDALPALLAHAWPGNVRELRNVLHTAAARARAAGEDAIGLAHLHLDAPSRVAADASESARDAELRAQIEEGLRSTGGNVAAAARHIGMRRAGIYEEMRRLGIDASRFRKR